MSTLDLQAQEYMSLAPGVGVIPEKYRNRGYAKLDFGPGEGGLSGLLGAGGPTGGRAEQPGISVRDFLAGIASGADPAAFAQQLLGGDVEPTPRARRAARQTSES